MFPMMSNIYIYPSFPFVTKHVSNQEYQGGDRATEGGDPEW